MFDLPKYGDGIGLDRLAALLEVLGIDRARLKRRSVVVTGSNGKGSTAAFAASIGRAAGLRTGLFTSPHLFRFNERFRIDGTEIDDATLAALVARVSAAIATLPAARFGAFEAQFALACLHFQARDCAFMVFEAGIGGRFDPVRLVAADVTCVTSLDLEHTALLGDTLQAIASDKSDACADGGCIIYGENCRALKSYLMDYNAPRGVRSLFVRDDIGLGNVTRRGARQSFDWHCHGETLAGLEIALAGDFQINNAGVAAGLFRLWCDTARPALDPAQRDGAIRVGLRDTRWPGRLEVIGDDPFTVVDVGHTPDGVTQALKGLRDAYGPDDWLLVLGVSRDKDIAAIAATLAPGFATIVCTSAHHKGADADTVARAARVANPTADIRCAPTIADAVALSRSLAASSGRRIYIAGGLFVAIEYAQVTRGGDIADLSFF